MCVCALVKRERVKYVLYVAGKLYDIQVQFWVVWAWSLCFCGNFPKYACCTCVYTYVCGMVHTICGLGCATDVEKK